MEFFSTMLHFSSLDPWLIKGWLALLTNYSPIKSASELLPPIQTPVPTSSVYPMMLRSSLTNGYAWIGHMKTSLCILPRDARPCRAQNTRQGPHQHTAFHTHPSQLGKPGGSSWRGSWSSNRIGALKDQWLLDARQGLWAESFRS